MNNFNLREAEKWLKRCLKEKVSINDATVVRYCMMGMVGLFLTTSLPVYAGYTADGGTISGGKPKDLKSIAIGRGSSAADAGGVGAIAIGESAQAKKGRAVVVGQSSSAEEGGVVVGAENKAAINSVVVGRESTADSQYSIALGYKANAAAQNASAMGRQAFAGEAAISLGSYASATNRGVAIGLFANVQTMGGIAIGRASGTSGQNAIGIGGGAKAGGTNSIAIGSGDGGQSDPISANAANANGAYSIAMGHKTVASSEDSLAFGREASSSGGASIAMGRKTNVSGSGSIGIGTQADTPTSVAGARSIGIGNNTNIVSGNDVVALGSNISASGNSAVAIGNSAKVDNKEGGLAVGANSLVEKQNAVAVGRYSEAKVDAQSGAKQGFVNPTGYTTADNRTWTGASVFSIGKADHTRQIKHLAAGTADTDAVNVAQLKSLGLQYKGNSGSGDLAIWDGTLEIVGEGRLSTVAENGKIKIRLNENGLGGGGTNVEYFSTSKFTNNTNKNNDEAKGNDSLAIGNAKVPNGSERAIAIGTISAGQANNPITTANGSTSIAIGSGAQTVAGAGNDAIAIGRLTSSRTGSVVLGGTAKTSGGEFGVVIGYGANGTADNAIAIGRSSTSGENSVAIGGSSQANGYSVAIGQSAEAKNTGASAFGENTRANFERATALGNNAQANANNATAVGYVSRANGESSLAVGHSTSSAGARTVAVGNNVKVHGDDTTALGNDIETYRTSGNNKVGQAVWSVILGKQLRAHNTKDNQINNVVLIGTEGTVNNSYGIGIGFNTLNKAEESIAIGRNTKVNQDGAKAIAIGSGANTNIEGAIALGSESVSNRALNAEATKGYDVLTDGATTETNATWKATRGALSIGDTNKTRQITNVAAGREDTDAVNVAQLKKAAIRYVSIKSSEDGNKQNNGATGADSVAIGPNASTTGASSITIGTSGLAGGVTYKSSNKSVFATAIGIGANINQNSNRSTAIGFNTEVASSENALAIGSGTKVENGAKSVAIGASTTVNGSNLTALGQDINLLGNNTIALGNDIQNYKLDGQNKTGKAVWSVILGKQLRVYNDTKNSDINNIVLIGTEGKVTANHSVGLGFFTENNSISSVAIGHNAKISTSSDSGIALGKNADVYKNTEFGIAIGDGAKAGSDNDENTSAAISIGKSATAANNKGIAIGYNAKVTANNAVAIGSDSEATIAATSGTAQAHTTVTSRNGGAWTGSSVFSIGKDSHTRQIINVAAATRDTDAVNFAQLKSTTLKLEADNGTDDTKRVNVWDGTLKVLGENGISTSVAGDTITIRYNGNNTMPLIYNGGSSSALGTQIQTSSNPLKLDFGDGLKAEKVGTGNDERVLITLDKDTLANDSRFKGPKGDRGEKGETGATGAKGDRGDIGPAGPAGPRGERGEAGQDGAPGPKGDKGDRGEVGPQGPQGIAGDTGPAGPRGPEGQPGRDGNDGAPGERGPIGPEGPRGPKGDQGVAGAQGPQGDKGETGERGPEGPQGPQGDKGETGERGPEGPQGPRGERGEAGPQGEQGIAGAQGPKGEKGDTGDRGPEGPQGPRGERGEAGPQGEQGVAGAQGPKGEKGDTGDVGPMGPAGPQGERGFSGGGGSDSPFEYRLGTEALTRIGDNYYKTEEVKDYIYDKNENKFVNKDGQELAAQPTAIAENEKGNIIISEREPSSKQVHNVASGIDPTKIGNSKISEENAKTVVGNLINENDSSNLKKVATVGDLQALAQAGLDFTGNNADVVVHRPLGTTLKVIGSEKEDQKTYSSANITTVGNKTDGSITIEFKETPEFKGVTLKDGTKEVTLTPSAENTLKLGGTSGTAPVKIDNLADGNIANNSKEAITGKQLKDLADKAGIDLADNSTTAFKTPAINKLKDKTGADVTPVGTVSLRSSINSVIDRINDGLTFGADTGTATKQYLGSKLEVKTGATSDGFVGDNIETKYENNGGDGTITIGLSKTPIFDSLTANNSVKVTNGPEITPTGIAMNNKKITGLANGEDGTDAVNKSQLDANKSIVTVNNGKSDDDITGPLKLKTTPSATGTTYDVSLDVDNNTIVVENGKLKAVIPTVDIPKGEIKTENGVAAPNADTDNDKLTTVATVVNAINESSFKVKTEQLTTDGTSSPNTTGVDIKAGNEIAFKAAKNLTVAQDDKNITFGLSKTLTDLTSVETKDEDGNKATLTKDGITISPATPDSGKTAVSLTKDGLNNGNNRITNVAAPTVDTDAANKKYVDDSRTTVTSSDNSIVVGGPGTGANKAYDIKVANTTLETSNGSVTAPSEDNKNKFVTAENIANAINATGFNVGDGTNTKLINPGKTVKFVNGNATTPTVTAKDDGAEVKFDINIDDSTLEITTDGKLKAKVPTVDTGSITTNTSGVAEVNNGDGNKLATVSNVAEAINNSSFKLKTKQLDTVIETGENTTGVDIKAGNEIDLRADKNLLVKQEDKVVTFGLSKTLSGITSIAGDTGAPTITLGTDNTVSVGGARITNVGTPTTGTDAANKQYVDESRTVVESGDANTITVTKDNSVITHNKYTVTPVIGEVSKDGKNLVTGGKVFDAVSGARTTVAKDNTDNSGILTISGGTEDGINSKAYTLGINTDKLKDVAKDSVEVKRADDSSTALTVEKDKVTDDHKDTYTVKLDEDQLVTNISTGAEIGANKTGGNKVITDGTLNNFLKSDNGKIGFKAGNAEEKKALGETIEFVGDTNLTPSIDSGKVKYALNSDLKGITSISNKTDGSGSTITLGDDSVVVNKPIYVGSKDADNKNKVVTFNDIIPTTLTSTTGGLVNTPSEDNKNKFVTAGNVAETINALGNNTIKLGGNTGETKTISLNNNGGILFNVKGATGSGINVTTKDTSDTLDIDLDPDNLSNENKTKWKNILGVGSSSIAYKLNGAGDKSVPLTTGFDFTNGTNTTAEIGDNGVVKFNLNDNLTGISSIKNGNAGPTITLGNNDNTIDVGGARITNVGSPTAGTDAANKDYVDGTRTIVHSSDKSISVTEGIEGNAKKFDIKIDTTGFATTSLNNINDAGKNVIKNLIDVENGKNTTITATEKGGKKVISVDAVDKSSKVTTTGTAISITPKNEVEEGNTTIKEFEIDLSEATKADIQKGVDAKNKVDNQGITFAGNTGTATTKKLGETVNITAEGTEITATTKATNDGIVVKVDASALKNAIDTNKTNIETNAGKITTNANEISTLKDNSLTFKASTGEADGYTRKNSEDGTVTIVEGDISDNGTEYKGTNLKTSIDKQGNISIGFKESPTFKSVSATESISVAGITLNNNGIAMGDKKITGLKAGTEGTDAVNISQLDAARTTVSVNAENATGPLELITTDNADGKGKNYNISLKLDEDTLEVTNDGKLKAIIPTVDIPKGSIKTENGVAAPKTEEDGDKLATVGNVAEAINNSSFKVKTEQLTTDGESSPNTTGADIKAGNTVSFRAAKNLVVAQDDKNITFGLSKTLEDLTFVETKDQAGNKTVQNANGITITPVNITNGKTAVSLTKDGLDNGNNTITNVATPVNNTDAANKQYVDDARTTVTSSDNSISVIDTVTTDNKFTYDIKVATTTLTSANGGAVTVPQGDEATKFVTAAGVANAINSLGNNTIKLGGDNNTETTVQNLNKENGLKFNVVGTNGISTKAENDTITISVDKSGEVATGNTNIVTGGKVFDAVSGARTTVAKDNADTSGILTITGGDETGIDAKAYTLRINTDKLKDVAKDSVEVKRADDSSSALTVEKDKVTDDHKDTYTVKLDETALIENISNGAVIEPKGTGDNKGTNKVVTDTKLNEFLGSDGGKIGFKAGNAEEKKALGETVEFVGDSNLTPSIDNGKVKYALNSDLTGISSIKNGDTGPTITLGNDNTISVGGARITNVGTPTAGTDAANKDYVDDKTLKFKASGEDVITKKLDETLEIVAEGSNGITANTVVDGGKIKVTVDGNALKTDINTNKTNITKNASDISTLKDNSLTFKAQSGADYVRKNSENGTLTIQGGDTDAGFVGTNVKTKIENGAISIGFKESPTFKSVILNTGAQDAKNGVFSVDDAGNVSVQHGDSNVSKIFTHDDAKIKYTANADKTKKEIALTDGFDFTNGTNTTAEIGDNGVVKFNLNDSLTSINSISGGDNNKSKIGLTDGALTLENDGKSLTISKDEDGIALTGLTDRKPSTNNDYGIAGRAATESAVKEIADKSFTFVDGGTGSFSRANSENDKKVKLISANDNISVALSKADADKTGVYTFTLANNLTGISSIKNGDTGPTITLGDNDNTISVGGAKITNVAAGVDGTDAVNVSQLNTSINNVTATSPFEYRETDENKTLVKLNDKFYKEEDLVGKEFDEATKKFKNATTGELLPEDEQPVAIDDSKVVISSKTSEPLLEVTNVASGINKEKIGAAKIETDEAQKIVAGDNKDGKGGLLDLNNAQELNKVATVGDLQAVAQAGLEFAANQGKNVHRPLGTKLSITGKDEEVQDFSNKYSLDNVATMTDVDNNAVRIGLLKTPRFDALELGEKPANGTTPDKKITLTPDAENGKLTLGKVTTSEDSNVTNPEKVVLDGLADGAISDNSNEAITGKQLKDLADKVGLELAENSTTSFKAPEITKLKNAKGEDVEAKTNLVEALNDTISNVNKGFVFGADDDSETQYLGSKLEIKTDDDGENKGSNIVSKYTKDAEGNGVINISLNQTDEIGQNPGESDGQGGTNPNRLVTEKAVKNYVDDNINNVNNNINKLNNGEAGIVVYTKEDGTRVVREGDNFYEIGANGEADKTKQVEKDEIMLSTVNPDGTTTKPSTLGNVAEGKNPKDVVNKTQLDRLNDATPFEYRNENNERLVKVDDKFYKESDLIGKYYDPISKKFKDIATGQDSQTQPTEEDITKVVISSKTTEPLLEVTNVASGLDKEKIGAKDATKADGSALEISPTIAKDLINGENGLNNLTKVSDLNKAATIGDLKALSIAGLEFEANQGNNLHRTLGSKLIIIGKDLENAKPTDFDDKYSRENIATKVDGEAIKIGILKQPTFEKINVGDKEGTHTELSINEKGDLVVVNGKDGANPQDPALTPKRVLTEDDAKIAYKANNKGINDKAEPEEVSLTNGFNFTDGTNTTAEIGENGIVKFNLKDALTGINSISGGADNKSKISLTDAGLTLENDGKALTVSKDGEGVALTGLTDRKPSTNTDYGTGANVNRAATEGAVKEVKNELDNLNTDLTNTKDASFTFSDGTNEFTRANKENDKKLEIVSGDNITVALTKENNDKTGKFTVSLNDKITVKEIKISDDGVDGPVINKDGIDAKDKSVTNIADGKITNESKDAISGKQLKDLADKAGITPNESGTGFKDLTFNKLKDKSGAEPTEAAPTTLKGAIDENRAKLNEGIVYGGDNGSDKQYLGSKLEVKTGETSTGFAGTNIETKYVKDADGNGSITIGLKENPEFKGITLKDGDNTVTLKSTEPNSITLGGKENENKPITIKNVAEGEADTDAVNVKQLNDTIAANAYTFSVSANKNDTAEDKDVINRGENLLFKAGNNLSVEYDKENNAVTYAVNKTSEFDKITVGEKGENGKDGVDGTVGVNGKDGSGVVINGKDGSIGLKGKDGANGLTMKGDRGPAGVDGKDREEITRLVYERETPEGTKETEKLATLNDGLKFAGDSGNVIKKKLNETVNIVGGVKDETKLAENNIGVVSDGANNLTIKLAKDVKGLDSVETKAITVIDDANNRTVVIEGDMITITKGGKSVTLSANGLDNGGNQIKNVAAGTEETDAVNVGQLNQVKGDINNHANAINQNAKNIQKMDQRMRTGFANSAAMSTLKYMEIGTNQAVVGAAVGSYRGNQAVAVGVQGAPTENVRVHAQVSVSPTTGYLDTMVGVGAAYRFNLK